MLELHCFESPPLVFLWLSSHGKICAVRLGSCNVSRVWLAGDSCSIFIVGVRPLVSRRVRCNSSSSISISIIRSIGCATKRDNNRSVHYPARALLRRPLLPLVVSLAVAALCVSTLNIPLRALFDALGTASAVARSKKIPNAPFEQVRFATCVFRGSLSNDTIIRVGHFQNVGILIIFSILGYKLMESLRWIQFKLLIWQSFREKSMVVFFHVEDYQRGLIDWWNVAGLVWRVEIRPCG